MQETWVPPPGWEYLWRRKWQPTPVLLPGKSRGQRSLVGCSPGGCRVRHDWVTSLHPPYHNYYHSLIWITVDVDGCLLELRDNGGWSLASKEQSESEVAQSRPTFCDPMDCNLPGSSVHRILQARILGVGCHFLPQGIFPTQGSNPRLPHCGEMLYRLSHQGSQRNKKGTKKPPRPGVPWGLAQHPKSVSAAFASLFVAFGSHERSSSVLRLLHSFPSQPYVDRKLLLTEALCQPRGKSRAAQAPNMRKRSVPPGPQAPPPSLRTTGSLRALGRVRRRGRGGGGGGRGTPAERMGRARTSVCPERRGESGRHLLLGSLRALPALGRLLRTRSAPRPQPWGSDSAAAVCVWSPECEAVTAGASGVGRAWRPGTNRRERRGRASSERSFCRQGTLFSLLNAPDFPGTLHVVVCLPLPVGLREWRSGRIP